MGLIIEGTIPRVPAFFLWKLGSMDHRLGNQLNWDYDSLAVERTETANATLKNQCRNTMHMKTSDIEFYGKRNY